MIQRQTIIHNVGDEPITVEQSDGSDRRADARQEARRTAERSWCVDPAIRSARPRRADWL